MHRFATAKYQSSAWSNLQTKADKAFLRTEASSSKTKKLSRSIETRENVLNRTYELRSGRKLSTLIVRNQSTLVKMHAFSPWARVLQQVHFSLPSKLEFHCFSPIYQTHPKVKYLRGWPMGEFLNESHRS